MHGNRGLGRPPLDHLPSWVAAHVDAVLRARGDRAALLAVLERSAVPVVLLDDDRRYAEVNEAAVRTLGTSRDELQQLRLDDLTPTYLRPALIQGWAELLKTGWAVVPARPDLVDAPRYFGLISCAIAEVLPNRHTFAFAPSGGPNIDPTPNLEQHGPAHTGPLTPRELEVLKLAAAGYTGPMIAGALVVSPATVRTHFDNIYAKLGTRDRAGAVAAAMRLGLIE